MRLAVSVYTDTNSTWDRKFTSHLNTSETFLDDQIPFFQLISSLAINNERMGLASQFDSLNYKITNDDKCSDDFIYRTKIRLTLSADEVVLFREGSTLEQHYSRSLVGRFWQIFVECLRAWVRMPRRSKTSSLGDIHPLVIAPNWQVDCITTSGVNVRNLWPQKVPHRWTTFRSLNKKRHHKVKTSYLKVRTETEENQIAWFA